MQRVAGIIHLNRNGVSLQAKGNFTYNLGRPLRESVVGSDGIHGFMEKPQVAFIEGEVTDRLDLDVADLVEGEQETITLELGNGKLIILRDAAFTGEGTGNSEEGNIGVRWESSTGEEVR